MLPRSSARYGGCTDFTSSGSKPVGAQLLEAAVTAGEARDGTSAYELLHGIGNLCIAHDDDPRYDLRRLIDLLLPGLQPPAGSPRPKPRPFHLIGDAGRSARSLTG